VITGYIVDLLETRDYRDSAQAQCELAPLIGKPRLKDYAYLAFVIPGLFFGLAQIFQFDFEAFGIWPTVIGLAGVAMTRL